MPRKKQTYEDWKKIVDKLEKEVENADAALVDIEIAKECQSKLLNYAKIRLGDYPVPVIMEEDEKTEETQDEENAEETPETPAE